MMVFSYGILFYSLSFSSLLLVLVYNSNDWAIYNACHAAFSIHDGFGDAVVYSLNNHA